MHFFCIFLKCIHTQLSCICIEIVFACNTINVFWVIALIFTSSPAMATLHIIMALCILHFKALCFHNQIFFNILQRYSVSEFKPQQKWQPQPQWYAFKLNIKELCIWIAFIFSMHLDYTVLTYINKLIVMHIWQSCINETGQIPALKSYGIVYF